MSDNAQSCHGITVAWSTTDADYTEIGEVANVGIPVAEAEVKDTSDHSSIYRSKKGGMIDGGTFSVQLNYKLDDTQHKALRAAVGQTIYVHVTAPAAITTDNQLQFKGVLTKCGPEGGELGDVFRGPFEVAVSGGHTWATV